MHDPRGNKFGFALRQMERRLRTLEARVGIESPTNPLNDPTDRRHAETKETQDVRSSNPRS